MLTKKSIKFAHKSHSMNIQHYIAVKKSSILVITSFYGVSDKVY